MASGGVCFRPHIVYSDPIQAPLFQTLKTTSIFQNWKFRILLFLEQQGVHEVLFQRLKYRLRKKEDLKKKDAEARLWIVQSVDDELLDVIKKCTTAREMIVKLEVWFLKKTIFSKYDLRKKLLTMKFKPSDSLRNHFEQFDKLISDLEAVGCKLEESEKVCHLLLTLPDEYKFIMTSLDNMLSISEAENIMKFVKNHIINLVMKYKGAQSTINNKENEGMFSLSTFTNIESGAKVVEQCQNNDSSLQCNSNDMDTQHFGNQDDVSFPSANVAPCSSEAPLQITELDECELKFSLEDVDPSYAAANAEPMTDSRHSHTYNSQLRPDLFDENEAPIETATGVEGIPHGNTAAEANHELKPSDLSRYSSPECNSGSEPDLDVRSLRPDYPKSPKKEYAECSKNETQIETTYGLEGEPDRSTSAKLIQELEPAEISASLPPGCAEPEQDLDSGSMKPKYDFARDASIPEMFCYVVLQDVANTLWCACCGQWCLSDAELQRHTLMHAADTAAPAPPQTSTTISHSTSGEHQTSDALTTVGLLPGDGYEYITNTSHERQINQIGNLHINSEEPETGSVNMHASLTDNVESNNLTLNQSGTSYNNLKSLIVTDVNLTSNLRRTSHLNTHPANDANVSVYQSHFIPEKVKNANLAFSQRATFHSNPQIATDASLIADQSGGTSNGNPQTVIDANFPLNQAGPSNLNLGTVTDSPNLRLFDRLQESVQTTPPTCDICGKKFNHMCSMRRHRLIIHSGAKPFSCDICKKSYTSRAGLSYHVSSAHNKERPFSCNICDKRFIGKSSLYKHMRAVHTEGKPFECDICNQSFAAKHYLTKHSEVHDRELRFECDVCNKRIRTKRLLISHKVIHTEETERKKYICDVCGKTFLRKISLNIHKSVHEPNKYICNDCGASFPKKSTLIGHLTVHNSNKPFKCKICKTRFARKLYLDRHKLTHRERQYKCDICGQRFFYKSTLNRHMKAPHSALTVPRPDRPPRR